MVARECHDHASRRLEIAPLVVPILCRINIECERTGKLRRFGRTGQVLEKIVRHYLVFFIPLAIRNVLFEVVVGVPIRNVAAGVGPDAAIQREQNGQLVCDGMRHRHGERVLGDSAVTTPLLDVPIRIEDPVVRGSQGRAQVQDRYAHPHSERWREVFRIGSVELGRSSEPDRRQGGNDIERWGLLRVSLQIQRSPLLQRSRRYEPFARQYGFGAGAVDGDDGQLMPLRCQRCEVSVEGEARGGRVRIAGLDLRDIGPRDAVSGCKRPAIETDLHPAHAGGIERPT